MDDADKLPLVFANRVIRQYTDHLVGDDTILLPKDYQVIRLVFRWFKGSWESLLQGDILQNRLLERIITVWGKGAQHKKNVELI